MFGAEFVPAAPALPVLAAAFVFISFGYLNGNLLVVLGLQRSAAAHQPASRCVVNLIGNLILVPLVGFMGAAWMTLVTEVVVFGGSLSLILRDARAAACRSPGGSAHAAAPRHARRGRWSCCSLADASLGVLIAATCAGYPALLFGLGALERGGRARSCIARGAISSSAPQVLGEARELPPRVVALLAPRARLAAEPRAPLRVAEQCAERLAQRARVAVVDQHAGAAVVEQVGDPADARGDDGRAAGHRLEQHPRAGVAVGGQAQQVGLLLEVEQLRIGRRQAMDAHAGALGHRAPG